MSSSPTTPRLYYLDSTRGIAATVVLLAHFVKTFAPGLKEFSIIKFLTDSDAAVLYFFVLSGYVLSNSLKGYSVLDWKLYLRFIVLRIFRIFPAFLIALIIYYIVFKSIHASLDNWLAMYWTMPLDLLSVFKQAILIYRFPNDPLLRLLPHDWTLSIEIGASLLLPFLFFSSKKYPELLLIFIFCAVRFLGLETFVFDFSLGIYLAISKDKLVAFFNRGSNKNLLLAAAFVLIVLDYFIPEVTMKMDFILIHHKSFGLVILLCFLLFSTTTQRILSIKPLVFIGKISYSFYLYHLLILFLLTVYFPHLNLILLLFMALGINTMISFLSYIAIEKSFIILGKRIGK